MKNIIQMTYKIYPSDPYNKLILIVLIILVSYGCKSDKKKDESNLKDSIEIVDVDQQVITEIQTAKQIFYSLPSPLETAMIIKNAGASFNPEILNPIENTTKYNTNKSMALNLGIYSTDLSYASLFDQTQFALDYMSAAREMVDGLGISDAISNETIERLQQNINQRDVIMDIISETFMNSSSYLKENNRSAISAMVLVGGWIEGLYIATNLVDVKNIEESSMVERIIDQKLSLINVIKLLEENQENEDVKSILVLMNELKNVFDKIRMTTTPIEVEQAEGSKVARLKAETSANIDREIFTELKEQVEIIRKNFTI